MASWLGSYEPAAFGEDSLPKPGAVIMQYTGRSDYTENDPPTYACVGGNDGIANWRTMENRLERLAAFGLPNLVGRSAAHYLQPCRKCKPEKENSGSVFHLPQQRLARCLLQKGKCAKNFYLTYKSY